MILPLPLIIVLAVLLVLVVLFLALKKNKRKFIWPLFILAAGVGAWYGIKLYNKKNPDLIHVKADIKISAVDLIHEYEKNESASNQKYPGKIVEVNGNIKEVKMDDKGYYTVILGDNSSMTSVRCSMDTVHQQDAAKLTAGSSTTVRGACTGFKKNELLGENLGSDVELNRCVLIQNKKQ